MIHNNYIAGEWTSGATTCPNQNPSDLDDVVGEYSWGDQSHVSAAVESAREAFRTRNTFGSQERAEALDKVGSEIILRSSQLGELLSREEGKTLKEATAEVLRAGSIFKFFAGEALRSGGDLLPSLRSGVSVEVAREPVGVVGLITPWNFPIAIPAWKIAPALAYGNSVVFKSAELVPGSASALAEILSRCGLPSGAFNFVHGSGKDVGDAIVGSSGVDAISFTGSQATGRAIAVRCAERMVKVQLEMGGKNPQVVLDDADLEVAVQVAVQSAFLSTGQRCTAASRFVVTEGIHDRFVDRLLARMTALKVDHALKEGTDIGPVVDESQLKKNLGYIDLGKREGARHLAGGEALQRSTRGYFLSPALFTEASNQMRVSREEIFGPVAVVIRARGYDEALDIANDTPFGLTAGICTTSLKHAEHFKANAEAGMVMVNLPTAGVDYHVAFGGRKGSSLGAREQGRYAADFYTTVKTRYVSA